MAHVADKPILLVEDNDDDAFLLMRALRTVDIREPVHTLTDGEEALILTGKDGGTPIIHFEPPDGVAFFGPVISRLPDQGTAGELWDHVVALARFPGFSELKRSLRERPQLVGFGVPADAFGQQEDWHAGSRRQQK